MNQAAWGDVTWMFSLAVVCVTIISCSWAGAFSRRGGCPEDRREREQLSRELDEDYPGYP